MRTATVEQISELIASLKALRRKVAAGERRAEVASSARGHPAGKGPPGHFRPDCRASCSAAVSQLADNLSYVEFALGYQFQGIGNLYEAWL
jgi:hypothetical protein